MHAGERFNAYSHLFGLALVLLCAGLLLSRAAPGVTPTAMAGLLVFAVATIALYAASTVFHSSRGPTRLFWQRIDHCAIYLLIAGSYTPFALAGPGDTWSLVMLGVLWAFALWAMTRELRGSDPAPPALWLYIGMGWTGVAAALPLAARLNTQALAWLLAGAALYSAGTVFYRNRRGWRHAHGTWHLFVLGGTSSHYMALSWVVA